MLSRMFRYLRWLLFDQIDYYDDLVRPRAEAIHRLREREAEVRDLVSRSARDPEGAIRSQECKIEDLKRQAAEAKRLGADEETVKRYWSEIDRKRADLVTLKRIAERVERDKRTAAEKPQRRLILRGRNQRGVPVYEGTWSPSMRRAGYRLVVLGQVAGGLGILGLDYLLSARSIVYSRSVASLGLFLALCVTAAGITSVYAGLRRLREGREFDRLFSIDELCDRFEVPELTLLQEARQRGITPKRIVNGREYFDFQEFGEAAVLLRAAKPPAAEDGELLRPATNSETERDTLLRVGPPDGK